MLPKIVHFLNVGALLVVGFILIVNGEETKENKRSANYQQQSFYRSPQNSFPQFTGSQIPSFSQNYPQIPNYPQVPNLPQIPNIPHIPNIPQAPNIPQIPNVPHWPRTPRFLGDPQISTSNLYPTYNYKPNRDAVPNPYGQTQFQLNSGINSGVRYPTFTLGTKGISGYPVGGNEIQGNSLNGNPYGMNPVSNQFLRNNGMVNTIVRNPLDPQFSGNTNVNYPKNTYGNTQPGMMNPSYNPLPNGDGYPIFSYGKWTNSSNTTSNTLEI